MSVQFLEGDCTRGGIPLYKLYKYVPPHRVGFLKTGAENYVFWSEIGSGFGEAGGHTPAKNSQEYPPPGDCISRTLFVSHIVTSSRSVLVFSVAF